MYFALFTIDFTQKQSNEMLDNAWLIKGKIAFFKTQF